MQVERVSREVWEQWPQSREYTVLSRKGGRKPKEHKKFVWVGELVVKKGTYMPRKRILHLAVHDDGRLARIGVALAHSPEDTFVGKLQGYHEDI